MESQHRQFHRHAYQSHATSDIQNEVQHSHQTDSNSLTLPAMKRVQAYGGGIEVMELRSGDCQTFTIAEADSAEGIFFMLLAGWNMSQRIREDLSFASVEPGGHGGMVDATWYTASSEQVVSEVFVGRYAWLLAVEC